MHTTRVSTSLLLLSLLFVSFYPRISRADTNTPTTDSVTATMELSLAEKLMLNRNYADALQKYKAILLQNRQFDSSALTGAIKCLQLLRRYTETDALIEQVIALHPDDWQCYSTASSLYRNTLLHQGYLENNTFQRGHNRNYATRIDATKHDHLQALAYLQQAKKLLLQNNSSARERSDLFFTLAKLYIADITPETAIRLLLKSDYTHIPSYTQSSRYPLPQGIGAPVTADNTPHLFKLPATEADAANDGELFRYYLQQSSNSADSERRKLLTLARFSQTLYGVETLSNFFYETPKDRPYIARLNSLSPDKTIARLESGVQEFTLPPAYSYLQIFQQLADTAPTPQLLSTIATEYENRRQYTQAAIYWDKIIQMKELKSQDKTNAKNHLQQITDSFVQFESSKIQTTLHPKLNIRFRNTERVQITARKINTSKIIRFITDSLKKGRSTQNSDLLNIQDIGWLLANKRYTEYLGDTIFDQTMDLSAKQPLIAHSEGRADIHLPSDLEGGAYFVEATLATGYTANIVLWLSDLTLTAKPLTSGAELFFTTDSDSGCALDSTTIRIFGYSPYNRHEEIIPGKNYTQTTLNSDKNGIALLPASSITRDFRYLISAHSKDGRQAFIGFDQIFHPKYHPAPSPIKRILYITDKPLYRPGEEVKIAGWIKPYSYTQKDTPPAEPENFTITIHDPKGNKAFTTEVSPAADGSFAFSFKSSSAAQSGIWTINSISDLTTQGNYFRLEEYKKPEFIVELTPKNDSATTTRPLHFRVHAEYNFGKPLQNAEVKYKIRRQQQTASYSPTDTWSWLYGNGYRQRQSTTSSRQDYHFIPPIISEPVLLDSATVYTDKKGNAEITLDPKKFSLTDTTTSWEFICDATIADSSQRHISAQTSIILQQNEFNLFLSTDQNYYYPNETVCLQATPVSSTAPLNIRLPSTLTLNIYKNTADGSRTLHKSYKDITQNPDSTFSHNLQITENGYYTLECLTRDRQQHRIVSSINICVCSRDSHEKLILPDTSPLQIIPKKKEYTIGETAELLLLNQKPGSTQLLFSGINSDRYPFPEIIPAERNYSFINYKIRKEDAPNTFIEAIATPDAEISSATAELFIPPKTKILKLKVTPAQSDYAPSTKARVTLHVTDSTDRPVSARAIVTVYDDALSKLPTAKIYPDIAKFFWGFTHIHYPQNHSSLNRFSYNIYAKHTLPMQPIGLFSNFYTAPITNIPLRMRASGNAKNEIMLETTSLAFKADSVSDTLPVQNSQAESTGSEIRADFNTGAYFTHNIKFDNSGKAVIDIPLPDSLTTWKINAWVMSDTTQVGEADSSITTSKSLMLIPSLPRYLIRGDNCSINTAVYNNSNSSSQISLALNPSAEITLNSSRDQSIILPAQATDTLYWNLTANKPSTATLNITAKSPNSSDIVSLPVNILEKGQRLYQSRTTLCRTPEYTAKFSIASAIKSDSATLKLQLFPTLHSFLSEVVTSLPKYKIKTNDTIFTSLLPELIITPAITSQTVKQRKIKLQLQEALSSLTRTQNPDGGWNWIGSSRKSSAYITALILRSLEKADQTGVFVPAQLITSARLFLIEHEKEQIILLHNYRSAAKSGKPAKYSATNLDALVYATLSLSKNENKEMRQFLLRDRANLSVYGLSLYATGLYYNNNTTLLPQLLRNISQYLVLDNENDTAFLRLDTTDSWWYWYNSEADTIANYLTLRILTGEDKSINDRLAHYLINNIKHLTRADSIHKIVSVLSALELYNRQESPNPTPEQIAVSLNNSAPLILTSTTATGNRPKNIFFSSEQLQTGKNFLHVTRPEGTTSPLYCSYTLSYFSRENTPQAHGLELKTKRQYYRLIPQKLEYRLPDGKGGEKEMMEQTYLREELHPGDSITAGDLIETEFTLISKNDYEYIYIQDNKPACLEPVASRSGFHYNGLFYYIEYRDRFIQYYVESMPRGTYSFRSRAYALFSGTFTAPAATGSGVFASELNSNSTGFIFRVNSKEKRKEEEK